MIRFPRPTPISVILFVAILASTGCGGSKPRSETASGPIFEGGDPGPGPMPGAFMGPPPRPGQILPPFLQDRLNLTDEQKQQVDVLQKEADGRLDAILTDEQKRQLKEVPERPAPDGRGGRRPGALGGPPNGPG